MNRTLLGWKNMFMQPKKDRVCILQKIILRYKRTFKIIIINLVSSGTNNSQLSHFVLHLLCNSIKRAVFLKGDWLTLTSFSLLSVQSDVLKLTTQLFAVGWVCYLTKITVLHEKQLAHTKTSDKNWFLHIHFMEKWLYFFSI